MASGMHHRRWRTVRFAFARTLPTPCPFCHELIYPGDAFDIDHRLPVHYGGSDDWSNLRAAHRSCNRRAGHAARMNRDRPQTHGRDW